MVSKRNTKKIYNLPEEVKFCKKCVISNQRPRISFNEEGVCSACQYSEKKDKEFDWDKREIELKKLLDKYRRSDGRYDVIVPCSGGKDAAYIGHELKHKYGMNPLTVTWAPHIYTDIGFQNLHNMIRVGNLPNILFTPPGEIHRKLTKYSFEKIGDPFQPFIYGQYNYPLRVAVDYQIPLIMYGENGEVEYGGDMKNAYKPKRDYKGDQNKHYFSNLPPESFLEYGIKKEDLHPYLSPDTNLLDEMNAEIHFYGYYKKWNPQNNFYYCVDNTGFKTNQERSEGTYTKFASLDDQLDGFHYYLAYIKFGLGRCNSDAAHEIRDGYISREEAVQLVKKFDGEFPSKHFQTFLEYCDISEDYFNQVIDSWRSGHIWQKNNNKWELKTPIE